MKKAFTLIELLVVIAIIAILAAILFPVFAQARDKARSAACLSNTKQMATALLMYTQDYDEVLFPYRIDYCGVAPSAPSTYYPTGGTTARAFYNDLLYPYTKNRDIFKCPGNKFKPVVNSDPGQANYYGGQNSFSINKYIVQPDQTGFSACGTGITVGFPLARMSQPADTLLIMDSTYYDMMPRLPRPLIGVPEINQATTRSYAGRWCALGNGPGPQSTATYGVGNTNSPNTDPLIKDMYDQIKSRHAGRINCVWMDGHAKNVDAIALTEDMMRNDPAAGGRASYFDPTKDGYSATP